jgi:hypothetical protein
LPHAKEEENVVFNDKMMTFTGFMFSLQTENDYNHQTGAGSPKIVSA